MSSPYQLVKQKNIYLTQQLKAARERNTELEALHASEIAKLKAKHLEDERLSDTVIEDYEKEVRLLATKVNMAKREASLHNYHRHTLVERQRRLIACHIQIEAEMKAKINLLSSILEADDEGLRKQTFELQKQLKKVISRDAAAANSRVRCNEALLMSVRGGSSM
tara:strand:+ start:406 stop:900 length:495 start_codon:yes stop_codon:yes gene_type:complete